MSNAASMVEIFDALIRFANADLRMARQEGSILIGGTVYGGLTLSYDSQARTYHLTTFEGATVARGRAGVVRVELARAYKVVDG